MKQTLNTSDIESLVNKVKRKQIRLDSEFQRGEVWGTKKKRTLIDTILRGWPVPPIILLEGENSEFEILDGLQRVSTIVDFVTKNALRVDGFIEPIEEELSLLHNLSLSDIKDKIIDDSCESSIFQKYYNRLMATKISYYEISDASEKEISELFNRFNAPLALSQIEKRNAYFGKTRSQIKELTGEFIKFGASKETIGFSNIRSSYEDIILKVCYTIQYHTIDRKISSSDLVEIYRDDISFDSEVIIGVRNAFKLLLEVISDVIDRGHMSKYSRSTIYSLIITIYVHKPIIGLIQNLLLFSNQQPQNYIVNSSLRNTYDEFSMYASTDAQSIRVRQYILHLICERFIPLEAILFDNNNLTKTQIVENANLYNYLENTHEYQE